MAALSLDDGTLWYDVVGSGPPMVFVHGGWLNGDAWDRQVEHFAADYRVIRLDLRGHGRTGATDARRYSVDLFVDDLELLLDRLDVAQPIVCGLSLGNLVAQEFLRRHPGRPAAAILGGPVRSMPPFEVPPGLKPFASPVPGVATAARFVGSKVTFRTLVGSIRTTTGRPWLADDPEVRSRAIDLAGSVPRAEFSKIFGALYRYDPPELSHVSTPTLAIYGEDESCFVKRQGRQAIADVETGRVRSIPDAAHLVNMDNPTAFDAAVGEFLADVGAAG